jgi:tetratricopeptide (TPR) repeat protein
LANKSLVIAESSADELCFGVLETIRHYAHDRLVEAGENDRGQSAHASYYLHFAEEANQNLFGVSQAMWLSRLDREYPNLRAALTWFEMSQQTDQGLRLAIALSYFWYIRLYMTEGRRWLERFWVAHKMRGEMPTPAQARAVLWLSELDRLQGDHVAAWAHAEESRRQFEALNDQIGLAETFKALGGIALAERRFPAARLLLEEGLTLQQALGNSHLMAWTLNALGEAARGQNDGISAEGFYLKALGLYRSIGDGFRISSVLLNLGFLALQQGQPAEARTWLQESLTICRKLNDMGNMECCLIGLAGVLGATGDSDRAVQVLGAVDAAMTANGMPLDSPDQIAYEEILAQLHTQLDDVLFAEVWSVGKQLTIEQAIDLALQGTN